MVEVSLLLKVVLEAAAACRKLTVVDDRATVTHQRVALRALQIMSYPELCLDIFFLLLYLCELVLQVCKAVMSFQLFSLQSYITLLTF